MAPPTVSPSLPPTAISPVTVDAATVATPYHTMAYTRPTVPAPRTARSAKLNIPRIPATGGQIRAKNNIASSLARAITKPPKPPKPPGVKSTTTAKTTSTAAKTTPAPPSTMVDFGDPVLNAQYRGLQAATDQSVQAAQTYADQATGRLGELAQLAGMSSVNPATSGLTGAVGALPGVLAQDAQQAQLTRSALGLNTANEMPALLRAQGVTNLQNFTEGVRQAQMKALASQQTLLEHIYAAAVSAGNAQLATNAKLALGQLDAQTRLQVSQNSANATLGAATIRANATKGGGPGGYKGLTASEYSKRYSQVANHTTLTTAGDGSQWFGVKFSKDPLGNLAPVKGTGYSPKTYFDNLIREQGLRPMDAVKLISDRGVTLDTETVYKWLQPYLGSARAAAATRSLTGEIPPSYSTPAQIRAGTVGA